MQRRRDRRAAGGDPPLEERFRAALAGACGVGEGACVLAAVSGGCDSVALLHLLRFHAPGVRVCAAHFDHAMRPGSAEDARWVAGLCAAWSVPLATERAEGPLRSEAEARRARHAFLRRAAAAAGAAHVATGHHADDQAETVLFRVLRGTGPAGLAGIAPVAGPLVRPLLAFPRAEVRRYARAAGLLWREDPTNRTLDPARNRIRHHLLPLVERAVAPGARRALARLADLARQDEAAWSAVLAPLEEAAVRREAEALILARDLLRSYDFGVASRILRNSLRQFGVVLDRTGTRMALQFITAAPSGREMLLPGGLRLSVEFDAVRVERAGAAEAPPDRPLPVDAGEGEGEAWIGGRRLRVRWRVGEHAGADDAAAFPLEGLRLPLTVRSRLPGDRVRTRAGTRTLKKLFGERRVPRSARARTPVVADAAGTVLWVPGLVRSREARAHAGQTALFLSILDD
ncbi:MAG TPA: tRNA lysidine(34) synthetase TilS [Longimicrobiaceae bacterium]